MKLGEMEELGKGECIRMGSRQFVVSWILEMCRC